MTLSAKQKLSKAQKTAKNLSSWQDSMVDKMAIVIKPSQLDDAIWEYCQIEEKNRDEKRYVIFAYCVKSTIARSLVTKAATKEELFQRILKDSYFTNAVKSGMDRMQTDLVADDRVKKLADEFYEYCKKNADEKTVKAWGLLE